MKIKDVLKTTALLLNRQQILDLLDGKTFSVDKEALQTIDKMTLLTNLVINELAGTYVPMVKVETVKVVEGKVYYKNLSEQVLRIVSVYSDDGREKEIEQNAEYFTVGANSVTIEYEYSPHNYDLEEIIGYEERDVPARVISYGLAAELSITESRFDEAVTWHKRFIDALSEICLPKNKTLKKRWWG